MENIEKLYQSIESEKQRSAWDKGVSAYALELVEQLGEQIGDGYFDELNLSEPKKVRAALLNGAADWSQYSWGGCSLIYDSDIAERLCCPSELKKTRNGERRLNSREEWLDVQARALFQAANRVCRHIRTLEKSGAISYTIPFRKGRRIMNKREYCESRESIAYYSGLNGFEIKGIEYSIDDYVYCVSGYWYGGKAAQRFHRCKIYYPTNGKDSAFF